MAKNKTISLRVDQEWIDRVDAGAMHHAMALGVPVSRNAYIELAVTSFMDELAKKAPYMTRTDG